MSSANGLDVASERIPPLSETGELGTVLAETIEVKKKDDCEQPNYYRNELLIEQQPSKCDEIANAEKNVGEDAAPIQPSENNDSQLPLSKARTIALVVTLTGAAFLNTLSVQASVIILPTIGRELDIPAARQQWVVSSYSLAFGTFLLLWGRLADV